MIADTRLSARDAQPAVLANNSGPGSREVPVFIDWHQRAIRISEVRSDGFVSFDFIIGDPDVYVEMLLSPEAFTDFCRDQGLVPDYTARDAPETDFPHIDLRDAARLCAGQNRT